MINLLWLKGGACGGNTMSFLSADQPNVIELVQDFGVRIIYHPTIGLEIGEQVKEILHDCLEERIPIDLFVFEGSVVRGPAGTGTMNIFADRPMQEWVRLLAPKARYVMAVGDCAAWGGIVAVPPNPTESTGLQHHKKQRGGFLGPDFRTRAGLPVINIPGCPAHPDWMVQLIVAIATGRIDEVELDEYGRPRTFFTSFVQNGCTNTHAFAKGVKGGFGKRGGCLYYEVGCRGSMTHSSCNRILWNRTSSKTRANHPCLGCTEPGFPHHDLKKGSIFKTMKYLGLLPKELPAGVRPVSFFLKKALR